MTQRILFRSTAARCDEGAAPARADDIPLPWLTRARLAPPRLVDVVPRHRLLQSCLAAGRASGVVLLLAPPGYGKTTLLAQLHESLLSTKGRAIWLRASARDDTPASFIQALTHAVDHGLRSVRTPEPGQSDTAHAQLSALFDTLSAERPVHVFIDDVDAVRDPEVLEVLERVAATLPPQVSLYMACRRNSGLRLSKLLSERKVRLFGAEDLRFAHEELEALLDGPPQEVARRVLALTQGFPVACRLMSDGVRATRDADRAFDLMRPTLGEWFDEQVLGGATPEECEFLMDSAVLAQFTLEILEHVPGRQYGWPSVQRTLDGGYYLSAVEAQPGWYGYLPLFAQHMTQRLRRSDPSRLPLLHRFAAEWFARRSQPVDAIRHAAETGDPTFAAAITEMLGAISLGFEKGAWIMAYSRDLPQNSMHEFPLVALGQVYLALEEGRFREGRDAFERLKSSPSLGRSLTCEDPWATQVGTLALVVEEVLRLYEDQPVTYGEAQKLEKCLQSWQRGPSILAGSIAAVLSAIYVNLHRFEEAACTADRGRLALREAGQCQAAFVLRIMGALSALALGHLREAALQVECAVQAAANVAEPQGKQVRYADLVRAQLHYEANEPDAAWAVLKDIPARPEMLMNAWFELQAGIFDAAAALAAVFAGPEGVRAVVHEAQRIARARGLTRLALWADVLLLREFVREGRHKEAFDMLEGESLRDVLATPADAEDPSGRERTELLVAAAHLMLALDRYREAEDFLSRIDQQYMRSNDVRVRIACGIATMTTAFRLRRHVQACSQLVAVVMTGVETGMTRRLLEHREQLLQVGDWMRRVGRPIPAKVSAFLAQIESAAASPRPAVRTGIYNLIPRASDLSIGGSLTQREVEVLALLADGLTSKEIAARLTITEGTVKTHRKKINKKLNVASRSRAVAAARKMLLV